MMQFLLPLIAVLGVGSIVAAFIGRRALISNHRQAWIDALRVDLALYLRELNSMHYAVGDLLKGDGIASELEERKRTARLAFLLVYWRIVLRLNRTEKLHILLKQKLDDLMQVQSAVPDTSSVDDVIDLARIVLKREWDVTKYGAFTDLMLFIKGRRDGGREMNWRRGLFRLWAVGGGLWAVIWPLCIWATCKFVPWPGANYYVEVCRTNFSEWATPLREFTIWSYLSIAGIDVGLPLLTLVFGAAIWWAVSGFRQPKNSK